MKRFAAITMILVIVFLIIVTIGYQCKTQQLNEKIANIEVKLDKYRSDSVDQATKFLNMNKALIINYGLSKWEAHYYSIMFDDFSKAYNIPWEIYPSVIRIESNFKGNAVSEKGAIGMTQLLESTGKGVAKKLGISYVEGETLRNDLLNMILGMTYLSERIQSSSLETGVKQYLGGPNCLRNAAKNDTVACYVRAYKTTVMQEFVKLHYMSKGIGNDTVGLTNFDANLFKQEN
jgi:soluble lytic murein transglycosylase-like protein